jgi:Protein of unknown function (DUF3810)
VDFGFVISDFGGLKCLKKYGASPLFNYFTSHMNKQVRVMLPVLLISVLLIRLFAGNKLLVEKYYSTGVYPWISTLLKYSFGWIPFSIGDIVYGLFGGWLLFKIGTIFILILKRKYSWQLFRQSLFKIFIWCLVLYVSFNLLWGLNYNRKGIADQLDIKMTKYSKEELLTVDSLLLEKANTCKMVLSGKRTAQKTNSQVFEQAKNAYQHLGKEYPFCNYQPPSIKSSAWGWLGNYVGFTGYYNPFSGEAQVNTTVPGFLHPFIACHEIAHQLGYAKENEANFVGYLAASSATDTAFQYSVYLDLFLYAHRNLYMVDSLAAKSLYKKVRPEIRSDLAAWRKFNDEHKSPLEPVFSWMYGKYLKNNEQPSGVLSYDEVTGFLIAYYKKFGKL